MLVGHCYRVFTPELPPRIPSLKALLKRAADVPIQTPSTFPAETPKSEDVNSHQRRFTDTAVWGHLHSNIPPSVMSYTQEPFPEIISEQSLARFGPKAPFRHREVIRDWVESLFVRAGHEKIVEFSTTVERAEKRGDEWVLTLRKEIPNKTRDLWWQETFDALVVASGHYYVPFVPSIPGLIEFDESFPGVISHSKHYRNPEDFRNKVSPHMKYVYPDCNAISSASWSWVGQFPRLTSFMTSKKSRKSLSTPH